VQPLFEHRMEFAGFDTRVLELDLLLPFPAVVRA
jgi:hypothetical protein